MQICLLSVDNSTSLQHVPVGLSKFLLLLVLIRAMLRCCGHGFFFFFGFFQAVPIPWMCLCVNVMLSVYFNLVLQTMFPCTQCLPDNMLVCTLLCGFVLHVFYLCTTLVMLNAVLWKLAFCTIYFVCVLGWCDWMGGWYLRLSHPPIPVVSVALRTRVRCDIARCSVGLRGLCIRTSISCTQM